MEGLGEWLALRAIRGRAQDDVLEIERLTKELARVDSARAAHEKNVTELSKNVANLTAEIAKQKQKIAELEANPVDAVDRKAIFDVELDRCEMQIDVLKELLVNGREH